MPRLLLKKSRRRVTLRPLVRVWLRRTDTIPWVWVSTMGVENTVSSCHYHDACLYHESLSMPLVHVYTMSPCLYHESMCIPWDLVNSMHPCLYHESLLITWVNVYNMSPEIQLSQKKNNSKIHLLEIQIQKFPDWFCYKTIVFCLFKKKIVINQCKLLFKKKYRLWTPFLTKCSGCDLGRLSPDSIINYGFI